MAKPEQSEFTNRDYIKWLIKNPKHIQAHNKDIANMLLALYRLSRGGVLGLDERHRKIESDLRALEQLIQCSRNVSELMKTELQSVHLITRGDCTCSSCCVKKYKQEQEDLIEAQKQKGKNGNEGFRAIKKGN